MLWIKRILWLLAILALALCHILTLRNVFALIALVLLLLPFFSWLLLMLAAPGLKADISVQDSAARNESFDVHVRLSRNALMPAMHMKLSGAITNLLTGETAPVSADHSMPRSGGADILLSATSPFCGKLSIDLNRLVLTDLLGLFRRRIPLTAHASLLVLPETFEPQIELTMPDTPDAESDDYSPNQPGGDPSELFGIRDYREGDALKSIHWKLSEKYDRTVVREMSLPVSHSILLLMDNCPHALPSPDKVCHACEAMISVSQSLADLSVPHRIGWFNHELETLDSLPVSSLDDLTGALGLLLSIRTRPDPVGIAERVLSCADLGDGFSRTLLFASAEPNGIHAIPGSTTLFLPEAAPVNALSCLPDQMTILII